MPHMRRVSGGGRDEDTARGRWPLLHERNEWRVSGDSTVGTSASPSAAACAIVYTVDDRIGQTFVAANRQVFFPALTLRQTNKVVQLSMGVNGLVGAGLGPPLTSTETVTISLNCSQAPGHPARRYAIVRAMKTTTRLGELFPETKPYRTGHLKVSKLHTIHFEECGNPRGKPICFLHGGPGGGIDPVYRRYFDPKKWRIVLHDQRGCGRSTPFSELRENTTWDLVADIEKLREHLGIDRWVVFGGSWGSTLALAYAETHPGRCKALVLRGIFLLRQTELLWFYQEGASHLFPDIWEHYLAPIPLRERGDMMKAYYKRLTSRDRGVRLEAARAWSIWEGSTSKLLFDPALIKKFGHGTFADAFARIEAHYFVNRGFLRRDDQLLHDVKKIRHIPGVIVQGRYDAVCPIRSAWDLHRAWPEAKLVIVPDAGHSMTEPGIRSALFEETARFARL